MFLSIIIPCYNSTSKLVKTMLSVLPQKTDDIEIILINDASTDTTYIDLYRIDGIKVVDSETNLGLGMARQLGLDNAKGKWITFIDHDDELTPNSISEVRKALNELEPEACLSTNTLIAYDELYSVNGNCEIDMDDKGSLHGKFYRKSFLTENNITFNPKLKTQEDIYFNSLVNSYCILLGKENVTHYYQIAEGVTYIWYMWEDSTSHKGLTQSNDFFEEHFDDYVNALIYVYDEIPKELMDEEYISTIIVCDILSVYHYRQSQYFFNIYTDKFDADISNFIKKYMGIRNYDVDSLLAIINKNPQIYASKYNGVCRTRGCYIPHESIKEFIERYI